MGYRKLTRAFGEYSLRVCILWELISTRRENLCGIDLIGPSTGGPNITAVKTKFIRWQQKQRTTVVR